MIHPTKLLIDVKIDSASQYEQALTDFPKKFLSKANKFPLENHDAGMVVVRRIKYDPFRGMITLRCEVLGPFYRLLMQRGEKLNDRIDIMKELESYGQPTVRRKEKSDSMQQAS